MTRIIYLKKQNNFITSISQQQEQVLVTEYLSALVQYVQNATQEAR